ncbi:hypothetical protein [Antrihabitans sp. YC2-6]|uniref:hypothetical protein n=1 Tax=Antrihabitans sp. YC2-6 TaxID=2799498 RepID=UPI0018F2EE97|nr:hypothetical protein [Antrihabitans sp. YC2-6]MBJ8347941.1 hypothetical protein [Antrihabitans sp. YC2-6]
MGLFEIATFPVRALVAFGEASIGVAKLVSPEGPVRLAGKLSDLTAEDRPLGKALAPGGVVDRVLEEDGVVARLTAPGGPLDRLMEPGGAIDRITAPGGPMDRFLAREGAIDRILEEGGILDRLLAEEGLVEQLVEQGGIIDRLAEALEQISKIGPLIESLDRPIRAVDESAQVLQLAVEPLRDFAGRIPGFARRATTTTPRTVKSERSDVTLEAEVIDVEDGSPN